MNMRRSQSRPTAQGRGTARIRIGSRFIALVVFSASSLSAMVAPPFATAVTSSQEVEKKSPTLQWNPPHVYEPVSALDSDPPCSLPDVLEQAGLRATELISHLQNFNANEQVRFEKIDKLGASETLIVGKFDYLVNFGEQSRPLAVKETRTPVAGSQDARLDDLVDKGLPILALIFHPYLQADYEMRCEGSTTWNNHRAWVIYFQQVEGRRPRTLSMVTPTKVYPMSIHGRAWIAADSGHVMHLETNLVGHPATLGVRADAISVDYVPVKLQSQSYEIWLPRSAVSYMDYGSCRTIIEHIFSDFRLVAVHTPKSGESLRGQ
jgi:hypothetical protein